MVLKTIAEIKAAVDAGKTVYSDTTSYTVVKGKDSRYYIANPAPTTYIGLHGLEGTKYESRLNGKTFWCED
jgi:hypothetical protein